MTKQFGLAAAMLVASALSLGAQAQDAAPLIAQSCAGCHGQAGIGEGAVPSIAGTDRAAFIEMWQAFRADEHPATIMNRIARGYTDDEVAALADYFSSLR